MTVRAVVFDIDGVLEITPSPHVMFEAWEMRLGLEPGQLMSRTGDIWAGGSTGAITEEEVHSRLGATLGVSAVLIGKFMDDVWTAYLGRLNTELFEYFGALRHRYRTGIISNSFVGAREREQRRYGFADVTDDIVYSHEVGIGKPDPRVYALACERLGVRPAEMVFLDDVPEFVEGARALGIHAILYQSNAQAREEIELHLRNHAR